MSPAPRAMDPSQPPPKALPVVTDKIEKELGKLRTLAMLEVPATGAL